jgi:hypothetical protein
MQKLDDIHSAFVFLGSTDCAKKITAPNEWSGDV